MIRNKKILVVLISLVLLSLFNVVSCQVGDGWDFGDGWDGMTPTPAPVTPNPGVERVGNGLLSGLVLFGVLPIAVGAGVLFLAIKTLNSGGDVEGLVGPIMAAVVAVILVEVCMYLVVFIVDTIV